MINNINYHSDNDSNNVLCVCDKAGRALSKSFPRHIEASHAGRYPGCLTNDARALGSANTAWLGCSKRVRNGHCAGRKVATGCLGRTSDALSFPSPAWQVGRLSELE